MVKSDERLGLYFHFPYCSHRCPYCDFTLTTEAIPHKDYLEACIREINNRIESLGRESWQPRPLTSLYFGGGTPGLWATEELGQFIHFCRKKFGFSAEIEITLEANPAEINLPLLTSWANLGINRLSLGVQSMRQSVLDRLGRKHTPTQVKQVVNWARLANIQRVNLDLIHGLSGEGVAEALFDLEALLTLNPSHISLYQLTIEPQTSFGARARRGEQLLEPEEELLKIYRALSQRLKQAQMPLYEVSNAALKGEESQHNLLYWTMGDYLGIGTGAHGRVNLPGQEPRGVRWQNIRSPKEYLKAGLTSSNDHLLSLIEEEHGQLNIEALDEETVIVGLRLRQGLILSQSLLDRYSANAQLLIQEGLLHQVPSSTSAPLGRWIATARGTELLDHLCFRLILG
jgi:putative oxygen-independent coproporphyrinogen III oxidase